MTRQNPVYFSIINGSDMVRIEVLGAFDNPPADVGNGQKLIANIRMKSSAFRCHYSAEFEINDFYVLRKQLVLLIYHLEKTALFKDSMGYLRMQFRIEATGHTEIDVKACDDPGIGGELSFKMYNSQSEIEHLVNQLDTLLQIYPIT